MSVLSREAILAAAKARKTVEVEVERLGGTVRLQEVSAAELQHFRKVAKEWERKGRDAGEAGLYLLGMGIINGDGLREFEGEEGAKALSELPIEVVNFLSGELAKLNGLDTDAAERAEGN